MVCFRCGSCCTRYHVRLDLGEARRIAENLGVPWDEWVSRCTEHSWPGTDSFLLARRAGACIYLEQARGSKVGLCSIQAFKPSACTEWNASPDRHECQQGLKEYWGLRVGPSGKPEGPEERVHEFEAFVNTLECSGGPDTGKSVA